MRAQESLTWGPISADTDWFMLGGGQYLALAVCNNWSGGSVVLNVIGPDNATKLSTITALTANGGGIVDLPPGQYMWALTNLVNAYLSVTRVPISE